MKKRIALLLGLILAFALVSCDALIDVDRQDDTTVSETQMDTYMQPEETTEKQLDLASEAPTVDSTDEPTEAPTEPTSEMMTEPIIEEPTELQEDILQSAMKKLLAEGHDMEQLEFTDDDGICAYSARLNHRSFRAGDTVEVVLWDLTYNGKEYSLQKMYGILEISVVQLIPEKGDIIYLASEDCERFTITVSENTPKGTYWFNIYYDGEDYSVVCPIIIY